MSAVINEECRESAMKHHGRPMVGVVGFLIGILSENEVVREH